MLEQILKQIENTKLDTCGVHYSPSLFAQAIIQLHADKIDYYVKCYIQHYSNKPQDQLIQDLDALIIDLMKQVMFRI